MAKPTQVVYINSLNWNSHSSIPHKAPIGMLQRKWQSCARQISLKIIHKTCCLRCEIQFTHICTYLVMLCESFYFYNLNFAIGCKQKQTIIESDGRPCSHIVQMDDSLVQYRQAATIWMLDKVDIGTKHEYTDAWWPCASTSHFPCSALESIGTKSKMLHIT